MRGRNLALVVAAVLFAISLPAAQNFSLDWQLDRMFPAGDPLVASYHRLEQRFGGNEIVLAVYQDPRLWAEDGSGLERLGKVSDRLAAVEGVQAVLSLAELHRILETLQAPMELLRPKATKPLLLDQDNKLAQAFAGVFEGYTHIRGNETVAVACMLKPLSGDANNHRTTIEALRAIMSDLPESAHDGFITVNQSW